MHLISLNFIFLSGASSWWSSCSSWWCSCSS